MGLTMENSTKANVTVCIITFNEEDRIRACLESVKWAGEIVVVDSYSEDKTVAICREYTDKVFLNKWPGNVAQKNYALERAGNEWVLFLDADERVSGELSDAIFDELDNPESTVTGLFFRRHSYYLGRLINHGGWYPDYQLRFCKRQSARWEGTDPHGRVQIDGDKKRIKSDIIHHPYRSISDQLRTVDNYSTQFADEMIRRGRKFNPLLLFVRPPTRFMVTYIWKKGFLDGLPGFINAVIASFYVFLKYLKWYERIKR